jgi:hypothetical protein
MVGPESGKDQDGPPSETPGGENPVFFLNDHEFQRQFLRKARGNDLLWHEVKLLLLVPTAVLTHSCPLPLCVATTTTVPDAESVSLWQESWRILPIRAIKVAARSRNGRTIATGAAESSAPVDDSVFNLNNASGLPDEQRLSFPKIPFKIEGVAPERFGG